MLNTQPCIFCEILAGRGPASFVYRDSLVAAFLDIQPVNPGHILVVPLQHAASLAGLDPETGAQLFRAGQALSGALRRSGLRCEGVNFLLADGETAGQEVAHVHLHVFPRYPGDGFRLKFRPEYYSSRPARADLDEIAEKIRSVNSGN